MMSRDQRLLDADRRRLENLLDDLDHLTRFPSQRLPSWVPHCLSMDGLRDEIEATRRRIDDRAAKLAKESGAA
jgi:hypothetical protein